MKYVCVIVLSFFFFQNAYSGAKGRLKRYLSHDSSLVASVYTVIQEGNGDSESKVEFRTSKGKLIGAKNFMSKDHSHGLGVMKAAWTIDSRFFVFSTIASGGFQPGHFPTFFFSSSDSLLHILDKFVGAVITNPEFELEFPDGVTINVDNHLTNSKSSDAIVRTLRLSELREK